MSVSLLKNLEAMELELPHLLADDESWRSMLLKNHAPVVEQVFRRWNEFFVYLQCAHTCRPGDIVFAPNPWPSAFKLVVGTAQLLIGNSLADNSEPPVDARLTLAPGSSGELAEPNGWYGLRATKDQCFLLLITDEPWHRRSPLAASVEVGKRLDSQRVAEILAVFRRHYPVVVLPKKSGRTIPHLPARQPLAHH